MDLLMDEIKRIKEKYADLEASMAAIPVRPCVINGLDLAREVGEWNGGGKDNLTASQYIERFELVAKQGGWPDQAKLNLLRFRLGGEAELYVQNLPEWFQPECSWDKTKVAFLERFSVKRNELVLLQALLAVEKRPDEGYEGFADRCIAAGRAATDRCDTESKQEGLTRPYTMGGITAKEVSSDARLEGKTIIITGANIGIGLETASDLYSRGGRVILACRDMMKAELARKEIISRYLGLADVGEVGIVRCDLSSLSSVRACANQILKSEPRIDIIINNAGIMMCPYELSEDGYELQLATNHLGHFLFTLLLLPRILKVAQKKPITDPSRIINLSSLAHTYITDMSFEDINLRNNYGPKKSYFRSKAANVFFTKSLAQRLEGRNVKVYAVHPGIVDTPLWKYTDTACVPGSALFMKHVASIFMKTPVQGAQTTLHCALTETAATETGQYYSNCKRKTPSDFVQNRDVGEKLFKISLAMVNIDSNQFDPFSPEPDHKILNGLLEKL